jgi:thiol-disulfide isomerase/thioredoxin
MTKRRLTRRQLLRTLASSTLVGVAGCLGIGAESSAPPSPEATPPSSGGCCANDSATAAEGKGPNATTGAGQSGGAPSGLGVGERPPDFSLESVAGDTISLRPVEHPTVLFFMAAWCTSCKEEEHSLAQLHEQYGEQVRLISIDVDPQRDSMADLRQFKQQYGGDWPHLMGTTELIRAYRITSLDTTYLLDRQGVTQYTDTCVTSVETFNRQLTPLLKSGDSA